MNCQVTVAGPLGAAALRAVADRHHPVGLSMPDHNGRTVLDLDGLDQPALRGLLTLLWDFGHDVVAVSTQSREQMP